MADSHIEVFPKKEEKFYEHEMSGSESLFCRKCVRYFSSKSEFSQHVEEHINENNDGKTSCMTYIEKYICSICGQQFEVKSDLIIHYNTVCFDAAYTCKHCKENCENSPFLQMHLLFHHNYSEEMLRDEGFVTDIENNSLVTGYTCNKSFRCKAFKPPPREDELYSIDNAALTIPSSSNFKYMKVGIKRENLAFNLLDKAYICEICSESFSRKCVLDIHVQKHVLKNARGKNTAREILQKSLIMKPENYCIPVINTIQESKNSDGAEVSHSNSTRAILKPCNVILGSSAWKNVQPKSKFKGVMSSTSTRRGKRKSKVLNIFEDKGQRYNSHKATSRPSDEISGTPAWKKIKLRSKIPNIAVSDEQNDSENSKKKTKLGRKIKNAASSNKQNDAVTSKKRVKSRSKLQNVAVSDEQKAPDTSTIAINSESSKAKGHKKTPHNVEKQLFICEICKKQFQDNFKLKRHCLIHTGERPYTCQKCKKTFTRDDHLKRHLKKVCSKKGNSK